MDNACIEANEFIKEFIWWKLHIAKGVFVNDNDGRSTLNSDNFGKRYEKLFMAKMAQGNE